MAAASVVPLSPLPLLNHAAQSTSNLISNLTTNLKTQLQPKDTTFDPKKHIAFTPPTNILSMSDLKLKDSPLSSFAVSEPFRLFSPSAVQRMREEIFQPQVQKYQVSSNLAAAQLRGYAKTEAPFTYQAWTSPEVLAAISQIANLDLVVAMDYEIGHINLSSPVSAKQDGQVVADIQAEKEKEEEEEATKPIVDWHTDSYPFVVVTMLSDCTSMLGGETVLRKGDGTTLKIRGPEMGYSVLLQGRYIVHKALRAYGGSTERITAVTSFRPRNHSLPDETVLTTVRPVSGLNLLYAQYTAYRFEILQKRLQDQVRAVSQAGEFDVGAVKRFLSESVGFLGMMDRQIVEMGLVTVGLVDGRGEGVGGRGSL